MLDLAKVVRLIARFISSKLLQINAVIEKPIELTHVCQSIILDIFWVGMRFSGISDWIKPTASALIQVDFYASQSQQRCFSLTSTVLKCCKDFVVVLQNKLYTALWLGKSNVHEGINKTPDIVKNALYISQKRIEQQARCRFSWIDFIKLLGDQHALS